MSDQILRQALDAHQATDDKLGKAIVAEIGMDNQKCGDAMLAIATSHLSCAASLLKIAGFTDAKIAQWLYSVADRYAAPQESRS